MLGFDAEQPGDRRRLRSLVVARSGCLDCRKALYGGSLRAALSSLRFASLERRLHWHTGFNAARKITKS
jgi:hypothetical protein